MSSGERKLGGLYLAEVSGQTAFVVALGDVFVSFQVAEPERISHPVWVMFGGPSHQFLQVDTFGRLVVNHLVAIIAACVIRTLNFGKLE